MLTIIFGALIGIVMGLFIALLQQQYGFISMGSGSFVVNSYPVKIKSIDIILTSVTVLVVGAASSFYPAKFLTNKLF